MSMKTKRGFRVESNEHGVVVFGKIRTEQLVAILETYETDDLDMIPDKKLADKLGAVLAIPWQEELAKKWHEEADKDPKDSIGVVVSMNVASERKGDAVFRGRNHWTMAKTKPKKR